MQEYANTLELIQSAYQTEVVKGIPLPFRTGVEKDKAMDLLFKLGKEIGLSQRDIVKGIMMDVPRQTA